MGTFSETVYIDVELSDFDEDEIVEYLEHRGYKVTKDNLQEAAYVDVAWHVNRGELKEALILLEREIPELKGIASLN